MKKHFHWQENVSEQLRTHLEKILNDNQHEKMTPFKSNKRRCSYILQLPQDAEISTIYLKKDTPPDLRNSIKNLWRWKSKCEMESANLLSSLGIRVVPHLGWIREGKTTYLVTAAYENAITLSQALTDFPQEAEKLYDICEEVFMLCWKHDIIHPDLHIENFLVRRNPNNPDQWEYALVDVYGVAQDRREHKGRFGLMRLYYGLRSRFSRLVQKKYDRQMALKLAINYNDFMLYYYGFVKQLWLKLDKRYSKKAKERLLNFSHRRIRWQAEPDRITQDIVTRLCDDYFNENYTVLKRDVKRQVYRITVEGKSYIFKTYYYPRYRPNFLRLDHTCWLNTNRLAIYGIDVAKVLAHGVGSDFTGYIILEDVGSLTLHQYAVSLDETEKDKLCERLGDFLASVHNMNVYHSDMTPHNILVQKNEDGFEPRLRLIDCDKINTLRFITKKMQAHNLYQLTQSFDYNNIDRRRYKLIETFYHNNLIKILDKNES